MAETVRTALDAGGGAEELPLDASGGAETPPLDPNAVSRAYEYHRARRAVRERRDRERRWASVRFWLVLMLVVAAASFLAFRTLGEIERVFGL